MNPETRLCWHPLQEGLNALRQMCLGVRKTPPHWDRVENVAGSGYPDLSWSWAEREGHIELKYRAAPPVREDSPVVVESITPHQRLWWRLRWESGGNAFVLLRLSEEYLLFPGLWATLNLGSTPLEGLRQHAALVLPRAAVGRADGAARILEGACRY